MTYHQKMVSSFYTLRKAYQFRHNPVNFQLRVNIVYRSSIKNFYYYFLTIPHCVSKRAHFVFVHNFDVCQPVFIIFGKRLKVKAEYSSSWEYLRAMGRLWTSHYRNYRT